MSGKLKDAKDKILGKDSSMSDKNNKESSDIKDMEIESLACGGCGCGNNGRCPVRIFGTVDLAPGSEVGLSYGSFVNLVPGTTIGLTPGSTVSLDPNTTVYLNPDATVGLTPGTTVGVTGTVGLNTGTTVGLTPGTTVGVTGTVGLNTGTTVGLTPGTTVGVTGTVGLNAGTTVGLAPGTTVGVTGTVGLTPGTTVGITPNSVVTTANNFSTTDIFTPTATPLTPYTITADGTYYSQPFDVSNYKDYTWYIENATQSDAGITVSPQFAPVNTTGVIWTPVYVPEPSIDGTAAQTTVNVAPGTAAVLGGGKQIQYTRLAITVTGLTAGQSIVVRGSIQGSQY